MRKIALSKEVVGRALVAFIAVGLFVWGLYVSLFQETPELKAVAAVGLEADGTLLLVCDVKRRMPLDGFDAPAQEQQGTLVAGINVKELTGWYQSEFSMSESRKGVLTETAGRWGVSRPAMFERYGQKIAGEAFTLERASGQFAATVTLGDGRTFKFAEGYCGRLTKPPF